MKNDPRVTKVGHILRKLSIDELPQLANVLRGEVSLVGPRPERPEFVALFSERLEDYPRRHQVRPGLTGQAQVIGGYHMALEHKLEADLKFCERPTFVRYLALLVATPFAIIRDVLAAYSSPGPAADTQLPLSTGVGSSPLSTG